MIIESFNILRGRDQFLPSAHLKEGTDLHLSVLLFDVALAEHNPFTVHVLMDVILEELF